MPKATYVNPVYSRYFADPFVFHWDGLYYAYGTGREIGGRVFEVLQSEDLVNWTSLGGAVEPERIGYDQDWWAPEVAFWQGRFYLYYSAGIGDKGHTLRVAIGRHPAGPFHETNQVLTPDELFAIDAHPFRDDDGAWYMFYARDFLDGERVGTALVVDRMKDMLTLEGNPRTVMRAHSDWQIFRRQRPMYGSVYDWHTLEGPFVVKRDGRYYCFYSGGAWEEPNYGVSYAVGDSPLGPFHEEPGDDPKVLRSVPGKVMGPGHSSITRGPNGLDYIVYHAWDVEHVARRMCIDRLQWPPGGPRCNGPTYTPQPVPRRMD